jgi:hypothetical protein
MQDQTFNCKCGMNLVLRDRERKKYKKIRITIKWKQYVIKVTITTISIGK